jgi:hypothetical protein
VRYVTFKALLHCGWKIVFSGISVGLGRNVCVIYAEIVYLSFFFSDMYLMVVTHVCLWVI